MAVKDLFSNGQKAVEDRGGVSALNDDADELAPDAPAAEVPEPAEPPAPPTEPEVPQAAPPEPPAQDISPPAAVPPGAESS